MRLVALTIFILFAGVCLAQPVVRTRVFTWTGGFSGCSNCGAPVTQFACSNGIGNWNDGVQTFGLDDVPFGYILTEVSVNLTGTFDCLRTGMSLINITLNGVIVDTKSVTGTSGCTCNTCDGVRTFSNKFFVNGFPGKFSAFNNYIQISSLVSPICLSMANLSLTFSQPMQKTVNIDVFPTINNTLERSDCLACMATNGSAISSPSSLNLAFQDPLPMGRTPISISLRAYGRWPNFYATSYMISALVQNTLIDKRSIPNTVPATSGCKICGGGVDWNGPIYMSGWPNYVLGGSNTLSFYQSSTTSNFMIGMVTVTITYI